jgi:HD-GYP domain-containing protein (c-di-GMP phosphodiesterase class II)
MLKRINVNDVRIGMYIDEVCGSWLDHPFWKKSFSLSTQRQLKTLRECGIHEVWIDTDKGLDVEAFAPVVTEEEENQQVDDILQKAVGYAQKERPIAIVALHEEVERSRKIHTKAKAAVMSIFHDMRMGKALQTEETHALVDEITQSLSRNSSAFLSLSRMKEKDHHTYLHSVAVCALMISVGKQFGIEGEELRNLGVAGLLHDTGMVQIPERILNKTTSLTSEEFNAIQTHPKLGWVILHDSPEMNEMVLDVCLHHHERTDGAGYPDGLQDKSLSLFSKICTVCDTYDTITSDRHYKKGYPPAEAIRKMAAWQPGQFDLNVFHAFVKAVGIYPSGTLVKLESGRLAVVTDQTAKSLLTPIVKVFFSTKSNAPTFAELIDLSKAQDSIASVENPRKWGLNLKVITGI